MSQREVGRELAAAQLRRIDAINASIHLAWKTAYYTRRARTKQGLPRLDRELLKDEAATARKAKRQTKQETATMIRMLAAQYGGRIERVQA